MKTLRPILISVSTLLASATCGQYILTLDLTSMDQYIGSRFEARVTEMATGKEVGRTTIQEIATAGFMLPFYCLVQGVNYNVDFYADVNGNGSYDAPPVDHAWRRTVANATMNTTVAFTPDENYVDIVLPPIFPYSQYNATWGGRWRNLTFGSTDTIKSSIDLTCDSIYANFMTAGVFGIPGPQMFSFEESRTAGFNFDEDTLQFNIPSPWTGSVYLFNGEVHGDIALSGINLQFTGSMGAQQILCLYTVIMGGNPFANGYFIVRELSIDSSAPALVVTGSVSDVSCFGTATGSITAEATGGTPPYSYAWPNGDTTETTTDIAVGSYGVTVTDADGCTATTSFEITQPPALQLELMVTEMSCAGTCDGSVIVNVSGGLPPYAFIWSTGGSSEISTNLCEGDYTITVTDINGCMAVTSFTLLAPDSIGIASILTTPASNGASNGTIEVLAFGGTGNLFYSLDGIVYQASNIFLNVAAGEYCVFVRDEAGCVAKSPVFEIPDLSATQDLSIHLDWYPNPTSGMLYVKSDIPVSIEVMSFQGLIIRTSNISMQHAFDLTDVASGMYLLKVSNGSGAVVKRFARL